MIYIFGDSHGRFNFNNLDISHINSSVNSITMFRIGRDNVIINFNPTFNNSENIFILDYGEVDCRCHIARQLDIGHKLDDVCNSLVNNYINTIKNNIIKYKKIIICSVVPPIQRHIYEDVYGPVTHEFPFIGTDEERVNNTKLINSLLKSKCLEMGYIFFDFYDEYAKDDGTLRVELSDNVCHIKENTHILEKIKSIILI